jgi:hypothetical protein
MVVICCGMTKLLVKKKKLYVKTKVGILLSILNIFSF